MKKVIYGVLAVSLTLNGYLLAKKAHVKKVEVIKEIVKEKPVDKVVMIKDEELIKAHLASLSEIEDLKNKLAAIENQAKDTLENNSIDGDMPKKTKEEPEDRAIRMQKEKEMMLERFANEGIDHEWAYAIQDSVQKEILEAGLLEKYDLQSVECKTTVCELTIKPFDISEKAHFPIMLSTVGAFMGNDLFNDLNTSFDQFDTESETIKMYLDKEKTRL